jgi:hypothetical protein
VLAVLVVTQLPQWPYGHVATGQTGFRVPAYGPAPAHTLPTILTRSIPGGDPVTITFPYAFGHEYTSPLLWQAEAGYRFRLIGGYAFHPDQTGKGTTYPNALKPKALPDFLVAKEFWIPRGLIATSDLVATTRITISKYHIGLIIVDRAQAGATEVINLFGQALGPPTVSAGDFIMWIVPLPPRVAAKNS